MVRDMIAERDKYRNEAAAVIGRVVGDDNSIDILADFVTSLVFKQVHDADPICLLQVSAEDWGIERDDYPEYDDLDSLDGEDFV